MQDINSVQFNDDVFENIASAETVDSSVRSQCTNYRQVPPLCFLLGETMFAY